MYLFGAVNPLSGETSALIAPTVNTDYFNAHLQFISRQAGANTHVVLVLDQVGWHHANALQVPDNITLLHLPPYSPELNPMERVWAYLKSHYLSNRVFSDYNDLFDTTCNAWNQLNEVQFQSLSRTTWITRENES